jgi:hypothetical protein
MPLNFHSGICGVKGVFLLRKNRWSSSADGGNLPQPLRNDTPVLADIDGIEPERRYPNFSKQLHKYAGIVA